MNKRGATQIMKKIRQNFCSNQQKFVLWTHFVLEQYSTFDAVTEWSRICDLCGFFFVHPTFEFLTRWGSDMYDAVRYSMSMNESPSSNIWSSQCRTIYVISMKTIVTNSLPCHTTAKNSWNAIAYLSSVVVQSTSRQMKNFFEEFTCTGTYGFKQRKEHHKYRFRWNRQAIARMWNARNFYGQSLVELRWCLICAQKELRACRAREVRNQRVIECSMPQ